MSFSDFERDFNEVGRLFYASGTVSTPLSSKAYFLFSTNNKDVVMTRISLRGLAGDIVVNLYENPTVTNTGTPLDSHRFNRRWEEGDPDASAVAQLNGGAVAVSANGDLIDSISDFGADGAGNKTVASIGAAASERSEWTLIAGIDYLIEVDNVDTTNSADIYFRMNWIEEN